MGRFWARAGRNGIRKGRSWIMNKRFLGKKLESAETGRAKGRNGRSWLRSGKAGIREKYYVKNKSCRIGNKKYWRWEES
jgi:hypothetical protein